MHANLIGGAWTDGVRTYQNTNPSDTRDVIGDYAVASREQALEAVASAHAAFPAWSLSTPQQRFDILDAVGNEIIARKAELGDLLAREEGKTLPEAIGEVGRAAAIFKFFAGEALRPGGEMIPSVRPGVGIEITREPLGTIGIITPWNFPIAIPAWKIAPALAYGNTVVFKPAEVVPGSAWALADILHRAGLPAGVFNLVMGRGSDVGAVLLEDERIAGVSFTGSVGTGQRVAAACVPRGAKVQLEMGGKNPFVVLDDADLNVAVGAAINSGFFSTGQRCTASSRVIVTDGIHDRFVAAMVEKMKTLKVDDARKAGTDIGPVVDDRQLAQDLEYIGIGQQEGAKLAYGAPSSDDVVLMMTCAPGSGHVMLSAMTERTREEIVLASGGARDRFSGEVLPSELGGLLLETQVEAKSKSLAGFARTGKLSMVAAGGETVSLAARGDEREGVSRFFEVCRT